VETGQSTRAAVRYRAGVTESRRDQSVSGELSVTEGIVMHGPFEQPKPLPFSDEQVTDLVGAVYEAQLALLRAIVREAERSDAFDAPRKIIGLTNALSALGLPGQVPGGHGGWFPYPPGLDFDDEP